MLRTPILFLRRLRFPFRLALALLILPNLTHPSMARNAVASTAGRAPKPFVLREFCGHSRSLFRLRYKLLFLGEINFGDQGPMIGNTSISMVAEACRRAVGRHLGGVIICN